MRARNRFCRKLKLNINFKIKRTGGPEQIPEEFYAIVLRKDGKITSRFTDT